ncbi:MAG: class I SAM-dependent methyltransferase, partial [Victivallales bacterium]|nr:class I SAM-dependent methyltransferase [Victivallales bacterium]
GAGFPALILALAYPQLQLTAIDSIGKKTAFVREAATQLELTNINVVTGRSREMARRTEWQGRFDLITARAVADARTIFRDSRAMLNPRGRYILYQTPTQAATELPQVAAAATGYGFHWEAAPEFELPEDGGPRQFIWSGMK